MNATVNLGEVQTLSKMLECELDPVVLFETLVHDSSDLSRRNSQNKMSGTGDAHNRMLLESCNIDNKQHLKSILMHKAALRIECQNNQVIISSLTSNGSNAMAHLQKVFYSDDDQLTLSSSENTLIISYPQLSLNENRLDEETRLKQLSPIACLRTINQSFITQKSQPYSNFLCGLFSFDFIATFEELPDVPQGDNSCPDYVFYLAEELVVVDHESHRSFLYSNIFGGVDSEKNYFEQARRIEILSKIILDTANSNIGTRISSTDNFSEQIFEPVECNISDSKYQQQVSQLKEEIVKGNIFQVVPSRTFSLPCEHSTASYQKLKDCNPSPYMFYMQDKDFVLFGASPESALKYQQGSSSVQLYPIAGTRPRGKKENGTTNDKSNGEINDDLDKRLEAELKLDHKEISEHMMLVDLARNDIARISVSGSVQIPRLLEVDRYSQVMHLVSSVQGKLRDDLDCFHAYQACMNMGTLTGAPKIKATELIRKTERTRRGSYGGAVGYINSNGDMDTCIVIRSAFCKNGIAYIQAGAGVVFDSDPKSESDETKSKAKAVIQAVQMAHSRSKG